MQCCSEGPPADGAGGGPRGQAGVGLVEVMVGLVVGLVASLVIMQTYSSSELYRRNLSGSGDALQSASIAAQRLDLVIQEAGAGLARGAHVWGCKLLVSYGGSPVLPRSAAFPSPFSGVVQTLRVAPLTILSGGASASDVLMVMAGDSASGNWPYSFAPTGSSLVLSASSPPPLGMALKPGAAASLTDLFLAVPQIVPDDPADCRLVQATTAFAPLTAATDTTLTGVTIAGVARADIPLNTTTYGTVDSGILALAPAAFHLGPRAAPIFALLGVNSDGELLQYDMLNRNDPQVFSENVFLLKARYGLDNGVGGVDNDNAIDEWVAPSESGWTMAELMDGRRATEQKIGQIKAIRVALVMRSSQPVRSDATTTTLELFQDLPAARRFSRDLSTDEQRYQYQVYEWVIPLRNMKTPPNV